MPSFEIAEMLNEKFRQVKKKPTTTKIHDKEFYPLAVNYYQCHQCLIFMNTKF